MPDSDTIDNDDEPKIITEKEMSEIKGGADRRRPGGWRSEKRRKAEKAQQQ